MKSDDNIGNTGCAETYSSLLFSALLFSSLLFSDIIYYIISPSLLFSLLLPYLLYAHLFSARLPLGSGPSRFAANVTVRVRTPRATQLILFIIIDITIHNMPDGNHNTNDSNITSVIPITTPSTSCMMIIIIQMTRTLAVCFRSRLLRIVIVIDNIASIEIIILDRLVLRSYVIVITIMIGIAILVTTSIIVTITKHIISTATRLRSTSVK